MTKEEDEDEDDVDDLGPMQSHVMAGNWQGTSGRGLWKGGEVKRLTRSLSALPPSPSGQIYLRVRTGTVHALCKFGAENVIHSTLARISRLQEREKQASVRSGMMAALCKERADGAPIHSTLYAKSLRPNSFGLYSKTEPRLPMATYGDSQTQWQRIALHLIFERVLIVSVLCIL